MVSPNDIQPSASKTTRRRIFDVLPDSQSLEIEQSMVVDHSVDANHATQATEDRDSIVQVESVAVHLYNRFLKVKFSSHPSMPSTNANKTVTTPSQKKKYAVFVPSSFFEKMKADEKVLHLQVHHWVY